MICLQGTIRKICRKGDVMITLAFNDVMRIWNYKTGEFIRSMYEENSSSSSKILMTEKMLIWSNWGKLMFHDLDKLQHAAEKCAGQLNYKLRTIRFHHEITDFAYVNHRILFCSKYLHTMKNQECFW
jgi:hypothetical protein